MMITAREFATAAERLRGSRWRKHGRNPSSGLDCAGVPLAAAEAVGLTLASTIDYDAGMPSSGLLWSFCRQNGDVFGPNEAGEGRIGLCTWGASDSPRHIVVMLSGRRIVHVDAHVRRVVVVPASWMSGRLLGVVRLRGIAYGGTWQA